MTNMNNKIEKTQSLPVRGAWIEIAQTAVQPLGKGRSPCGERGLKFGRLATDGGASVVAPRAGSVD